MKIKRLADVIVTVNACAMIIKTFNIEQFYVTKRCKALAMMFNLFKFQRLCFKKMWLVRSE